MCYQKYQNSHKSGQNLFFKKVEKNKKVEETQISLENYQKVQKNRKKLRNWQPGKNLSFLL